MLLFSAGAAPASDVVVIDPGHGGFDAGIRGQEAKESSVVLEVAEALEALLRADGKKVYLTRKVDGHLSIAERIEFAAKRPPGLFLSIHLSDSENFAVYVTWYRQPEEELTLRQHYGISSRQRRYLPQSRALASAIEKALKEGTARGVYHREMSLPVLNAMGVPAVLVEMPSRGIKYDEGTKRLFAQGIYNGIILYGREKD